MRVDRGDVAVALADYDRRYGFQACRALMRRFGARLLDEIKSADFEAVIAATKQPPKHVAKASEDNGTVSYAAPADANPPSLSEELKKIGEKAFRKLRGEPEPSAET